MGVVLRHSTWQNRLKRAVRISRAHHHTWTYRSWTADLAFYPQLISVSLFLANQLIGSNEWQCTGWQTACGHICFNPGTIHQNDLFWVSYRHKIEYFSLIDNLNHGQEGWLRLGVGRRQGCNDLARFMDAIRHNCEGSRTVAFLMWSPHLSGLGLAMRKCSDLCCRRWRAWRGCPRTLGHVDTRRWGLHSQPSDNPFYP